MWDFDLVWYLSFDSIPITLREKKLFWSLIMQKCYFLQKNELCRACSIAVELNELHSDYLNASREGYIRMTVCLVLFIRLMDIWTQLVQIGRWQYDIFWLLFRAIRAKHNLCHGCLLFKVTLLVTLRLFFILQSLVFLDLHVMWTHQSFSDEHD